MAVQAQHPSNPHGADPRIRDTQLPSIDFSAIDTQAFLAHMPFAEMDDSQRMLQSSIPAQRVFHPVAGGPAAPNTVLPSFGVFRQPALNSAMPTPVPARKRRKEASTSHVPLPRQQQHLTALQLVDLNQTQGCLPVAPQSGVVSTGLRLAFDDEHSTVTSSRPEIRSGTGRLLLKDEISAQLLQQQEDLNHLIKLQAEQFRQTLEDQMHRQSKSLLLMIDEEASRRLHEKDLEIDRVNKRNMELEERIRHLSLETHMWQSKAKNNEAMVAVLRTNLQQAVVHSREQSRMEGCGDSEADDAASVHIDENAGAQQARAMMMMMRSGQDKVPARCCKKCRVKEVSILLIPCLHLCLCNDCKGEIERCPVCNTLATACVEVYLS